MKSFFDYASFLKEPSDNRIFLGISYIPKLNQVEHTIYKIEPKYVYRPDKIAFLFYGDADLTWVINEANDFIHGFKEYTLNREIKIPTVRILKILGII